jgi:hypothetical protein
MAINRGRRRGIFMVNLGVESKIKESQDGYVSKSWGVGVVLVAGNAGVQLGRPGVDAASNIGHMGETP